MRLTLLVAPVCSCPVGGPQAPDLTLTWGSAPTGEVCVKLAVPREMGGEESQHS